MASCRVINSMVPLDVGIVMEGRRRTFALDAGCSLLVLGKAEFELPQSCEVIQLDMVSIARMLAHLDHARGAARQAGRADVAVIPINPRVTGTEHLQQWMIEGFACSADLDEDAAVGVIARHLVRQEAYGLVRFLLEEGYGNSVASLAERYGLSLAQFNRRCRRVLGHSLKLELRIMRASMALLDYSGQQRTFTHVAQDHGYASLSHFCTDVKGLIGRSPLSVYRAVKPVHG